MNGSGDTAGVAQHLKDSVTAWDCGVGRFQNSFSNFRRHNGTFFTSTRGASYNRFYVIGRAGDGQLSPSYTIYSGDNTTRVLTDSTVSPDAQAEAFPAAATDFDRRWPSVVNTEEFLDYSRALFPLQNIVSMAAYVEGASISPGGHVIACDADGRLYSCGDHNYTGLDFGSVINLNRNALGHGPKKQFTSGQPTIDPRRVRVLQRVYGDDDSFSSVKFVQVAAARKASFALSEDGHIWMAGDVSPFASAGDFSDNSTDLPWFREKQVSEYYDRAAELISESLTFTDIWAGGDAFPVLMAKTDDGRLFMCGSFRLGQARTSKVFHEVGGFVTAVTLTNGGSGYTTKPTVTASDPDNPAGSKPTFDVLIGSGSVSGIRLVNAGWGYSAPPTLTFSGGGGTNAAATCELFDADETWISAAVGKELAGTTVVNTNFAAITSAGKIYFWGGCAFWNVDPAAWGYAAAVFDGRTGSRESPREAYLSVVGGETSEFTHIEIGLNGVNTFGLALTNGANAYSFGIKTYTPDSTDQSFLKVVDFGLGVEVFVSSIACTGSVGALRTFNNEVYTYGLAGGSLGQGSAGYTVDGTDSNRKLHKIAGSDVWQRVCAGTETCFFLIRRDEEIDEYGLIKDPLPPYQAES